MKASGILCDKRILIRSKGRYYKVVHWGYKCCMDQNVGWITRKFTVNECSGDENSMRTQDECVEWLEMLEINT